MACRVVDSGSRRERLALLDRVVPVEEALSVDHDEWARLLPQLPADLQHAYVVSLRLSAFSPAVDARRALVLPELSGFDLAALVSWALEGDLGEGGRGQASSTLVLRLTWSPSSYRPERTLLLRSLMHVYANFDRWEWFSLAVPGEYADGLSDPVATAMGSALMLSYSHASPVAALLHELEVAPLARLEAFTTLARDSYAAGSDGPRAERVWDLSALV